MGTSSRKLSEPQKNAVQSMIYDSLANSDWQDGDEINTHTGYSAEKVRKATTAALMSAGIIKSYIRQETRTDEWGDDKGKQRVVVICREYIDQTKPFVIETIAAIRAGIIASNNRANESNRIANEAKSELQKTVADSGIELSQPLIWHVETANSYKITINIGEAERHYYQSRIALRCRRGRFGSKNDFSIKITNLNSMDIETLAQLQSALNTIEELIIVLS